MKRFDFVCKHVSFRVKLSNLYETIEWNKVNQTESPLNNLIVYPRFVSISSQLQLNLTPSNPRRSEL